MASKRREALELMSGVDPSGRIDILAFGLLDRAIGQLDERLSLGGIGQGLVRGHVAEIVAEYLPQDRVFNYGENERKPEQNATKKARATREKKKTSKARTRQTRIRRVYASPRERRERVSEFNQPRYERHVNEGEIIDAEFVDISDDISDE